jgi:hypothetical protein
MSASAFKKVLILRASSDQLKKAIQGIPDDLLNEVVKEVLLKSARSHKGSGTNAPLIHFGHLLSASPGMREMLRHGIGHHVSRYKAALAAGQKHLAHQHGRAALRMVNMGLSAAHQSPESGGFSIDAPNISHWEKRRLDGKSQGTSLKRYNIANLQPGERARMYGIRARKGDVGISEMGDYRPHSINPIDIGWLRDKPIHPREKDPSKGEVSYGNIAFPFEDISIDGKHIPVHHEHQSSLRYEPHELDYHPIMATFDLSSKHHSPEIWEHYKKKSMDFLPKIHKFSEYLDNLKSKPWHSETPEGPSKKPVHGTPESYSPEFYSGSRGMDEPEAPKPAALPPVKSSTPAPKMPAAPVSVQMPKPAPQKKLQPAAAQKPRNTDHDLKHYMTLLHHGHMKNVFPEDKRHHATMDALSAKIHEKTGHVFKDKDYAQKFESQPAVKEFRQKHKYTGGI